MKHYIQYKKAGRPVTHSFSTWDAALKFIERLEAEDDQLEFSYVRVKQERGH